jgi:hypothetical protein
MLNADNEFLTIFLVFYRKFAAPSKLLKSLIAKFEEAARSAVDYLLQMIVQTRYPHSGISNLTIDVAISWHIGFIHTPPISVTLPPMQKHEHL